MHVLHDIFDCVRLAVGAPRLAAPRAALRAPNAAATKAPTTTAMRAGLGSPLFKAQASTPGSEASPPIAVQIEPGVME